MWERVSVKNGNRNDRIRNRNDWNRKWPPKFLHKIAQNLNLWGKLRNHFLFRLFPFRIRSFRFPFFTETLWEESLYLNLNRRVEWNLLSTAGKMCAHAPGTKYSDCCNTDEVATANNTADKRISERIRCVKLFFNYMAAKLFSQIMCTFCKCKITIFGIGG